MNAARRTPVPALALRASVALVVLAGGACAADPLSIESLNQQRSKWESLRTATLQVEGRCLAYSATVLKMTGCDLEFVFGEGVAPPTVKPPNVEITGKFETRGTKLVFVITRLKPLLSDLDAVRARRAGINTNKPQEWYALAEWAAHRGRFYEDRELLAEAADLNEKGLLTEYRQVAADDFGAVYKLADKVTALGLPNRLRARLMHDAARRELAAARRRRPPDYSSALTHILERLPGSGRPATLDDAATGLKAKYQADPLGVYESAGDPERQLLHRFLYTEAALERIESRAAADGGNGFALAAEVEQSLPEFTALPEEYRQREIDRDLQRAERLSREQLLTLSQRLAERGQSARAEEVQRRWIAGREETYRERGVGGRMNLAQEYIDLLGDTDRAAEILIEVHREHPGAEFARAKLVELGYQYDTDGNWTRAPETDAADPVADAIRQGFVRRGMTDEQVAAAMGGRPASIQRFAARGGVTELWTFPERGVSVLLKRKNSGEPRIAVEISDLTPTP